MATVSKGKLKIQQLNKINVLLVGLIIIVIQLISLLIASLPN